MHAVRNQGRRYGLTAPGAISAALHFGGRLLLPVVASRVVSSDFATTILVTVGLGALFAAEGTVKAFHRSRVHVETLAHASRTLLGADPHASRRPEESDDTQVVLFEGVNRVERMTVDVVPDLVADGAASVVLGVALAVTETSRTMLALALALAVGVAFLIVSRRVTAHAAVVKWGAYRPLADRVLDVVDGRVEIAANGRADAHMVRLLAEGETWKVRSRRAGASAALAGRAPMVLASVMLAATLLADRVLRGESWAVAFASIAAIVASSPAFVGLARGLTERARLAAELEPFDRLLASPEAPKGGDRTVRLGADPFEAVDLAFDYGPPTPGRVPLLNAVSFTWNPGEVLVVSGPNGSGKSTLLRLLLGFAEPTSGALTVGRVPLASVDRALFRKDVAYLAQRSFASERGTVEDAISLLVDTWTPADAEAALRRVDVWSALERANPLAPLATTLGVLSTGQKQRVALARLLLRRAPVVLLDEPDANLDAAGLVLVRELVLELRGTTRVALVAHTQEFDAVADVVVRLPGRT
ncbi:MAG: ABC transporter ATP-binding protein [Polyangiaceae bacterium]